MNVAQLIDIVRLELDDSTAPYLWTDVELLEYLVDAENEACRRGRLLLDSDTTAVCVISVTSGTATWTLDPRVIQINRIQIATEDAPLIPLMQRDLDECYPGWRTDTSATPLYWCPDWGSRKIRLVGTPTADLTLNLTVERLPLADLDQIEDIPEIPVEYHANLRHWMLYRALNKRDSETMNLEQAQLCKAAFAEEFGPPRPAYDEQWISQYYMGAWVGRR